jgi:peptide/nickel transport system substrate-binding protein
LNQLYAVSEVPWPDWQLYTVYQPLVSVNSTAEMNQGVVQYLPGLAQNWTVSANGTVYTFNLRQNVKFSDGNQFNAYQAWAEMYGFYYLSANSTAWLESYPIFNMTNVVFGPATLAMINQSGIINPSQSVLALMQNSSWPIWITNQNTINFRLSSPFQWFPGTLIAFDGLMFDVQWVMDHGGFGTPTAFNSYFNQHPIPGSGPYTVTGVSEDAYVTFAQNPNYWGNSLTAGDIQAQPIWDPGHAKNVVIYYKPDDLSRYTDLANNVVQLSDIQPSDWGLVTTNPQYQYQTSPPWSAAMTGLVLNTKEFPTNITDVRLAIVHAINMSGLIQNAYQGEVTQFVGPEYALWKQFYDLGNVPPYQYNLTLAKQELGQANVTNMPTLTLRTVTGCDVCSLSAQVVQSDLGQIGLTVNIIVATEVQVDDGMGPYVNEIQNPNALPQMQFINDGFSWGPATLTPADYWVTFVSNHSLWGNFAVYYNPVVQKCVDSFTSGASVSQIQNLCTTAQQQIYNDAPYDWVGTFKLWLPTSGSIVWKSGVVKGFVVDPVWAGQTTEPIFNTVTFG